MFISDVNELLSRYEKLRQRIALKLFGGIDPGNIISTADTGDKHMSDCVRRLDTSKGCVLFYKPRDCRSSDLLGEINELVSGRKMVPEQVCGDGYSFQKAVPLRFPSGNRERIGYYTLLGQLWAVFYILGSTDMHSENVIPAGDIPVVIDTETLFCPRAKGFSGVGDFSQDYGEIFPELRMSAGESMVLPRFYAKIQNSALVPDGREIAEDCATAFEHGAAEGYRTIMAHGAQLCRLLDRYDDIPIRFITRSTSSYYRMTVMYNHAPNDDAREAVLKRLEKGLKDTDLVRWKGIIECERRGIIKGDIPYFSIDSGETCLRAGDTGGVAVEGFAEVSPIENAKHRMALMNESDLAVQIAYIHGAIRHTDLWVNAPETACSVEKPPLSVEESLSEVLYAVRELDCEKIPLGSGCVMWHAPLITGNPPSLYGLAEGFSGILYFCNAVRISPIVDGEEKRIAASLAEACFADMKAFGEYLLDYYTTPASEHDIYRRFEGGFGFTDGLAGYLWALKKCGDIDPETADRLLERFSEWQIPDTFNAEMKSLLLTRTDEKCRNDTLYDGEARRAAVYLTRYVGGDGSSLGKAGAILADIREHRLQNGSYVLFEKNRRQYFLPAFLRGSTGIVNIMLRYAELLAEHGGR